MSIYVSQLNTYPLKSAKGFSRNYIEMNSLGLAWDRVATLVHAEGSQAGVLVSQRTKNCAKLATVDANVLGTQDGWYLEVKTDPDSHVQGVEVPLLDLQTGELKEIQIHKSKCLARDAGDMAAQYMSDYLDLPVRLMVYPKDHPRMADTTYAQMGDVTSFADGFPLLVTGEGSLMALNRHLPSGVHIGMERFRPNIVLTNALPFEEDAMHHVRIGNVEIEMVKPCSRCIMTTINQETGERTINEPLETLAQIRKGKGEGIQGVFFGQNAIPRKLGTIRVGDEVEILSTRPMHPALEQASLRFEG